MLGRRAEKLPRAQTEETRVLPELDDRMHVPGFLEPYGYSALSDLEWGAAAKRPPKLIMDVTGHCCMNGHTYYLLECALILSSCDGSEAGRLIWRAARRLAHLRSGLHDPVKKELGDKYKTFFNGSPFAGRLKPPGTSARINEWCRCLAYSINDQSAPPMVVAVTLRLMGAPDMSEQKDGSQSRWRDLRRRDDVRFVDEAVGREVRPKSQISAWSARAVMPSLGREALAEEIDAGFSFPSGIKFSVDQVGDQRAADISSTEFREGSSIIAMSNIQVAQGHLADCAVESNSQGSSKFDTTHASETGTLADTCSLVSEDMESGDDSQGVLS